MQTIKKSVQTFILTSTLLFIGSGAYSEDFESYNTVRNSGQAALSSDFYSTSYAGKEIGKVAGYNGENKGYNKEVILGANLGIGYNTELFVKAPYSFSSVQTQNFDNGQSNSLKDQGFMDMSIGAKYRLFLSQNGKNEVQVRGIITNNYKDATIGTIMGELSYQYHLSDTDKIAIAGSYSSNHYAADNESISAVYITRIAQDVLCMPFIRMTHHDAYHTYSTYNTEAAALSTRFTLADHWHITPEVGIAYSGERDTNYYVNNYGAVWAKSLELKLQREF